MLSVVVPVYNTSQYLSKCIESLLNQTYKKIEIILVDDGSLDESPEICNEYARNYQNIKVIHQKNAGLISAWIAGTKLATGKFVGYVDSDDYVNADYYQILMKPIVEYDCDVSICGFTKLNKNMDIVYPASKSISGLYVGNKLEYLKHNFYNNFNIQNSRGIKVFRKELVMKNIPLLNKDITLGEDMTITIPCILDASSIYVNNEYFGYCYRLNEKSMSHFFNPKLIHNYQSLFDVVIQIFEKKGYLNQYVYKKFVDLFITVVGLIAFSDNMKNDKVTFLKELKYMKCSAVVLRYNCNTKFARKLLKCLMQINAFHTICTLADLKKHFRKEETIII